MDVMLNVPADTALWEEAAELAWRLDHTGTNLPAHDILIACCARRGSMRRHSFSTGE